MAKLVQQSTASDPLFFFLVLSSDHLSPATGKTPTVTISKNGAAFGSPSGSVTEIANGWYQVAGNATDTATLGDILLHASEASSDNCDLVAAQVVAFNPRNANLGLSNVSANVAQWNGTNVSAPATAGIPDINVKNIVNVAAALDANNLLKVDTEDWKGGAVPAVNVTGVPLVDLKYTLGTISPAAAGSVSPDWGQVVNKGSAVNLTATQIQSVNNLAVGTDSINTIATSGSTLTTGSAASGTYANTATLDGVYWQIADAAGTLDMYFQFSVGTTGVPTTAVWTGGLTSAVDTLKVFAYNWGGAAWDQVGTLNGTTSLIINEQSYDFTTAHVGTGGNLGLVRLRFQNTGLTTANFYTDQVLCGYTNVITYPSNFSSLGISAGGHISNVDTLTTYTGDTPQTGDSYARLGAPAGASVSADIAEIEGETDTLLAGVTVTTNNDKTGYSLTQTFPTNFSSLSIDSGGNVSITSNIKKNTAQANFMFVMTDSTTHNPKTGLTVAATRSLDGGAFASCANAVSELSTGTYTINLAATDVNANHVMLRFTSAGADDLNVEIVTVP